MIIAALVSAGAWCIIGIVANAAGAHGLGAFMLTTGMLAGLAIANM